MIWRWDLSVAIIQYLYVSFVFLNAHGLRHVSGSVAWIHSLQVWCPTGLAPLHILIPRQHDVENDALALFHSKVFQRIASWRQAKVCSRHEEEYVKSADDRRRARRELHTTPGLKEGSGIETEVFPTSLTSI